MIATIDITVGEKTSKIEVNEGDGVLLFYFLDGILTPQPLMIGDATAEGFVDAALIALRIVSQNAHKEIEDGKEEQDSSES